MRENVVLTSETEWQECLDPMRMAVFLFYRNKARPDREEGDRKELLLAAACLRRIRHLLPDERSLAAIDAVEHYADEKLPDEKLASVHSSALAAWGDTADIAAAGHYATPLLRAMSDSGLAAWHAIDGDLQCVGNAADAVACFAAPNGDPAWQAARTAESLAQIEIIRCLYGNPFQHPPPLPSRLAPQVQCLARTIYDERTFDRLPELARELEATGGADPTILNHCRLPGLHARGCWVLDLVLRPA